jgi:hypothetical protein
MEDKAVKLLRRGDVGKRLRQLVAGAGAAWAWLSLSPKPTRVLESGQAHSQQINAAPRPWATARNFSI